MKDHKLVVDNTSASSGSCPMCGAARLRTTRRHETFDYGTGPAAVPLKVFVPALSCDSCSFSYTTDEADVLRHEAVCAHLGILSPAEVKELREQLGMNRAEFAKFTKISEASIGRWESGAGTQNAATDQYLRLLEHDVVVQLVRNGITKPSKKRHFRCLQVVTDAMLADAAVFELRKRA